MGFYGVERSMKVHCDANIQMNLSRNSGTSFLCMHIHVYLCCVNVVLSKTIIINSFTTSFFLGCNVGVVRHDEKKSCSGLYNWISTAI